MLFGAVSAEAQSVQARFEKLNAQGHAVWVVEVVPPVRTEANIFAVELNLTVTGAEVVSAATAQNGVWLWSNPGHNPFTGTITQGLWTGSNTVFLAAGSEPVTGSAPIALLHLVTTAPRDSRIVLSWNHMVLADLAALRAKSGSGRADVFAADYDGDGDVDGRDFLIWQRSANRVDSATWQAQYGSKQPPRVSADFDLDGDVDGRDFLIWQRNSGMSGVTQREGDADGDGDCDSADLTLWRAEYGF
jgi:hypothetical protein